MGDRTNLDVYKEIAEEDPDLAFLAQAVRLKTSLDQRGVSSKALTDLVSDYYHTRGRSPSAIPRHFSMLTDLAASSEPAKTQAASPPAASVVAPAAQHDQSAGEFPVIELAQEQNPVPALPPAGTGGAAGAVAVSPAAAAPPTVDAAGEISQEQKPARGRGGRPAAGTPAARTPARTTAPRRVDPALTPSWSALNGQEEAALPRTRGKKVSLPREIAPQPQRVVKKEPGQAPKRKSAPKEWPIVSEEDRNSLQLGKALMEELEHPDNKAFKSDMLRLVKGFKQYYDYFTRSIANGETFYCKRKDFNWVSQQISIWLYNDDPWAPSSEQNNDAATTTTKDTSMDFGTASDDASNDDSSNEPVSHTEVGSKRTRSPSPELPLNEFQSEAGQMRVLRTAATRPAPTAAAAPATAPATAALTSSPMMPQPVSTAIELDTAPREGDETVLPPAKRPAPSPDESPFSSSPAKDMEWHA